MECVQIIQIILPFCAICVAISVPAWISYKQNKIALFKERFSVYSTILIIQNNTSKARSIFQSRIATQKIKHSSEWQMLFVEIINALFEDKTISTLVEDFEKHIKKYYINFLKDFDQVDMNQVYYESDWLFFDPDDIGPEDNENLLPMRNKLYMDIFWEVKRISLETRKIKFLFNNKKIMYNFVDSIEEINKKIMTSSSNNDDIALKFNDFFSYIMNQELCSLEREVFVSA